MKQKNKAKIFLLSLFLLTAQNVCSAENINDTNDIGEIHIKEVKEVKEPDKNIVKIENNKNVGMININENGINSKKRDNTKPLTKESEDIYNILSTIVSNQNNKDYESALNDITNLVDKYPEYISLRKWKAIYQNRLLLYEESNNTLEQITLTFPLSAEKINKDKMILAYKIDNDINLGNYDKAQNELIQLNEFVEKENSDKLINDINEKKLYDIIYSYNDFMISYYKNNNDINKEKLDVLWNKIPKKNQKHLDIFYGFNLDNLEYIYGKFYNRKDLLKQYVKQENSSKDKNIIEKVKDAKSIIFATY